ncbi:virulence protein RhuM/Fic/DOC family protein [Chitinophaga sp. G-6-1-13]|uniref:Virulence protein RhuM/Fic/DOC family protein n=2 Tax=Chitinophaga fulva TaxID=2728842 RepID=A0A848GVU2_9BACT|nr:virulence protein RhuM/Fic/DOC family protein [Chitinophaga fulva]
MFHLSTLNNKHMLIYQTQDGQTSIEVKLEDDMIWLTQAQMVELFQQTKQNISLHINNIYKEEELEKKLTIKESMIARSEGARQVTRQKPFYSLDVVISVGYRVKSRRGTQFRIWANKVLKDYLVQGYALNEQRLKEQSEQLTSLKNTIRLLGNVMESHPLQADEATGLLKVLTDYAYALDVLDRYDHQQLLIADTTTNTIFQITYHTAMEAIHGLKEKFGGSSLFGNEKDDSFRSSLATIYQTFDGKELYPSIEEKAAHLLYFVIKNHSFSDGNKRIAAFLFIWFMEKNNLLYKPDGSKRIADNALVALTLMIAESKTDEMEMMIKVVVNLINILN